jgi:AraC family transcriptional regulator of adaptative response/methylated-DNA-[protein]-cysteine methyltransferase
MYSMPPAPTAARVRAPAASRLQQIRSPDALDPWIAVEERDASFDGRFVYAVTTTGVYCRPSCPSRRPARRNVAFFPAPAAAEEAGYRPCRRCAPREERAPAAAAVERARTFLERHPGDLVSLAALAREAGLSAPHLQRTFKRLLGMSPKEYQDALRLDRLRTRLRSGETVSRATYEAGFGSSSRVYERSDSALGMTPAAYRRGGAGMRIAFTVVDAVDALGRMLVGVTERGVCAVSFGDTDAGLEDALRRDFPRAEVVPGGPVHRDWIERIVQQLRGERSTADVPLDVHGTAFQWKVWKSLQDIPSGRTRSYSEVAAAIGRPKATRAVARACASNHVAVLIPCHRVVREDGALGGYRWGLDRKRRLLEVERR